MSKKKKQQDRRHTSANYTQANEYSRKQNIDREKRMKSRKKWKKIVFFPKVVVWVPKQTHIQTNVENNDEVGCWLFIFCIFILNFIFCLLRWNTVLCTFPIYTNNREPNIETFIILLCLFSCLTLYKFSSFCQPHSMHTFTTYLHTCNMYGTFVSTSYTK